MRTTFFLAVLFAAVCSPAFAQSDGLVYMNAIGKEFNKISQDMMSYTSAVNHGKSARKVEKRRNELLLQVKNSEKIVRGMKPFHSETKLRDSVAAYFNLTHIVLTEDYGKILDLEDIAEQSYDAMEAYLLAKEKANEKLDASFLLANSVTTAFAAANNITIRENDSELSKKLKAAAKVNAYSNLIYLLFFKSYKNEAYLLAAFNSSDVGAMEQARNALQASSNEDLTKIGPVESFQGDNAFKVACQNLLKFYQQEASDKMPDLIEFHVKRENFEKMKKAMDTKRPSERTQQDVDSYNKTVNEFNASVNKSNAINADLNRQRGTLLKAYNEAHENLLSKYTPKHK